MNANSAKILLFVILIALFPISKADTLFYNVIFQEANEVYQEQQYDEAIQLYSQIVDQGNEGAILFYNLGNAYYKAKDKANALLWYERALRLSPANEDIKHNIAFVNQTLVDKIDMLPEFVLTKWWNTLSKSMTSKA